MLQPPGEGTISRSPTPCSSGGPRGRALGGTYRSVSLTFTGEPSHGARLQVMDARGNAYCADGYTSGTSVAAADLTTSCWSATATHAALPSLSDILAVELRIKSGKTAATIAGVCVTGIDLR